MPLTELPVDPFGSCEAGLARAPESAAKTQSHQLAILLVFFLPHQSLTTEMSGAAGFFIPTI